MDDNGPTATNAGPVQAAFSCVAVMQRIRPHMMQQVAGVTLFTGRQLIAYVSRASAAIELRLRFGSALLGRSCGSHSVLLATFAARCSENLTMSMTTRPCVPRPISSAPSSALTRNSR